MRDYFYAVSNQTNYKVFKSFPKLLNRAIPRNSRDCSIFHSTALAHIVEGEVEIRVSGQPYALSAGDAIIMPANETAHGKG